MKWRSNLSAFLSFSRKDRIGALILVTLILFFYALPYWVPAKVSPPIILDDSLHAWVDSSPQIQVAGYRTSRKQENFDDGPSPSKAESPFEPRELFVFNPNTLDGNGWARLGLQERTVRTIINYRNKGGRFYKKEDLQKIWGLPDGFYNRVAPYIQLENKKAEPFEKDFVAKEKEFKRTVQAIDINKADTTDWKDLPGIGSKLAARIVLFRNKLGGFASIDQVGETYGLADSTFKLIKTKLELKHERVLQIKINSATQEELSAHPYIKWKLAKAMIAYREQHGSLKGKQDLQKMMLMEDKDIDRLLPYLSFE